MKEYHYTEGTLIVALVDPESQLFLWQGTAEGVVDPGAQSGKDIRTAVQKMFADFPSSSKASTGQPQKALNSRLAHSGRAAASGVAT